MMWFRPFRKRETHEPAIRRSGDRRGAGGAAAGRAARQGGAACRRDRAQARGRHLREHRMHSHQGHGGERLRGAHGPSCARIRRARRRRRGGGHAAGLGTHARHFREGARRRRALAARNAQRDLAGRPRALRIADQRASRRRADRGGIVLPRRGRPRLRTGSARHRHGALPDQRRHDGSARAARAPADRRRQLYRPGIRADVPALRLAGHHRGALAAPAAARGRGSLRRGPGADAG